MQLTNNKNSPLWNNVPLSIRELQIIRDYMSKSVYSKTLNLTQNHNIKVLIESNTRNFKKKKEDIQQHDTV